MHIWVLTILFLWSSFQENPTRFQIQPEPLQPGTCEGNRALLGNVSHIAKELGKDEVIIAVAKLGKGEKPFMNKRRLYTITTYLDLPPEKLITAEGDPTNGHALMEFYVKGKPFLVLAIGKNQELEVGDCQIDFNKTKFYMPKRKNR